VCAASDLAIVRDVAPDLLAVVPGVRLADSSADDQARLATPGAATVAGAGLLVIGRTVSGAGDPEAAALRVAREVASV
jgi:orotidine-5'-phosphate decarboxylase